MAITSMDGLVAALAAATQVCTFESSMTSKGAGDFQSLWTAAGAPGAGATPATGAGAAPTNSTAGAIPYTNPTGSNTGYLGRLSVTVAQAGTMILVDRLVHTSGLSGTSTSAQTVDSTAITRDYTSNDCADGCWLEFYTATGSTSRTATVSYTNQSGTSGQSGTATIPATTVAGQIVPVSLASGDIGVQSVQTVTLSGSTGTAGNFGITLTWRIAAASCSTADAGSSFDYAALGLPIIQNSACLAWILLCSSTTTGQMYTEETFIQG